MTLTAVGTLLAPVMTPFLAPAVFGPWMNISGSFPANWWRERRGDDEIDDVAESLAVEAGAG